MLSRKNRQRTALSDQLQFVLSAVVDAAAIALVKFHLLCVKARVGCLKAMLTT